MSGYTAFAISFNAAITFWLGRDVVFLSKRNIWLFLIAVTPSHPFLLAIEPIGSSKNAWFVKITSGLAAITDSSLGEIQLFSDSNIFLAPIIEIASFKNVSEPNELSFEPEPISK